MANPVKLAIPTPAVLSKGYGLRVIDYTAVEMIAECPAGQTVAQAQTDYLPSDHLMRVERIVISPAATNSTTTGEIGVYEGDTILPQRGRDWTPFPAGTVAVAEYPSYLTIRPTLCLLVAIAPCAPGDTFLITAQYQLVQKVIGQAGWPSS